MTEEFKEMVESDNKINHCQAADCSECCECECIDECTCDEVCGETKHFCTMWTDVEGETIE